VDVLWVIAMVGSTIAFCVWAWRAHQAGRLPGQRPTPVMPALAPPMAPIAPAVVTPASPAAEPADPMAGPSASRAADGHAAVINGFCPIMPEKSMADKVPAALRRTWRGEQVGLCCDECTMAWDALDDAARGERVAKVLRPGTTLPTGDGDAMDTTEPP
jgi:hypothetical protein